MDNGQNERILRCTCVGERTFVRPEDSALIITGNEGIIPDGYGLYLADDGVDIDSGSPCSIYRLPDGCEVGSFVSLCDERPDAELSLLGTTDRPDRTLFVTGQCNSNCIMCPYTERYRMNAEPQPLACLLRLVQLMNPFSEYLCITGGEPTLLGDGFIALMRATRDHFQSGVVHVLTNGRTFAYRDFLREYQSARPYNTLLGIPLHASNAQLHDAITQAPGSFEETLRGLDELHAAGEHIEIRIVTSALNQEDLPALATMIVRRYPGAQHVCFMGLEMMGNAMLNRDKVWVGFDKLMPYVSEATEILIHGGIQVQLYNYPLCLIDRHLTPLYRRSITPSKVEYLDECGACSKRDWCGGFFRTTKVMPGIHVKPFGGGVT